MSKLSRSSKEILALINIIYLGLAISIISGMSYNLHQMTFVYVYSWYRQCEQYLLVKF